MVENASEADLPRNLNHPHSGNWYGARGKEKLHFRFYLPGCQPKALIFFIHGFGGSCNDYQKVSFFEKMTSRGYALVAPDLLGHGHSDGLKFQVLNYRHFIDDITYLLSVVVGDADMEEEEGCFKLSPEEKDTLASLPVFLLGESLGGLLAVLAALDIQNEMEGKFKQIRHFLGVLLFSPCLEVVLPPAPITWVIRPFAKMFPGVSIPKFLMTGLRDPSAVWSAEVLEKYPEKLETRGHDFLTFGTFLQIEAGTENALSRNEEVKFPILVLGDPDDKVVKFQTMEVFVTNSSTPETEKKLFRMEGALHDLISNIPSTCADKVDSWCTSRINNIPKSNGH